MALCIFDQAIQSNKNTTSKIIIDCNAYVLCKRDVAHSAITQNFVLKPMQKQCQNHGLGMPMNQITENLDKLEHMDEPIVPNFDKSPNKPQQ